MNGRLFVVWSVLLLVCGVTANAQPAGPAPRDAQMREDLARLPEKFDRGTGIDVANAPLPEHRRVARLIEDARGQPVAPGWGEARVGQRVRRYYRPDINGVAYLEFEIEPAGFVIVPVGRHDHPVSSWNAEGEAPGATLERMAAERGERAVKLYKLDSLSYAAENARGQVVATLGSPMLKLSGIDPEVLDVPRELSEFRVAPQRPVASDEQAAGTKHLVTRSGPASSELKVESWESWDELKRNYGQAYGTLAEAARRRAAVDWKIDDDIEERGEGLAEGQLINVPLLTPGAKFEVEGPGASAARVQRRGRAQLPPVAAVESASAPSARAPFIVKIRHADGRLETRKFFVERADAARSQVRRRSTWSAWTYHYAGSSTDQRDYNQFTYKGCYNGCGPTAWAMLFGWGDYRASRNDSRWRSRWGLYRENGGRGANAVAPKEMDDGIKNISREINGQVKTFCAGSSGATPPWDMPGAADYLSGRTGTALVARWNSAGVAETRLRNYAITSIRDYRTPVIIGTGWLTHYPLAWKYAWRKRTTWYGSTEYQRIFYVNQGWGGSGNAWVPGSTWFAGEIRP